MYPAAFYGEERPPVERKEGGAQHSEDSPSPAVPGHPPLGFLQGAASLYSRRACHHVWTSALWVAKWRTFSCLPSLSFLTISFLIYKMGTKVLPLNSNDAWQVGEGGQSLLLEPM